MTYRGRVGWGGRKEAQEGRDICTHIADSHCCASETNNTAKQLYSNKEFHTKKFLNGNLNIP